MSSTNVRTSQDLWNAALGIFDAARELTESERASFIESRCAGDAELFAEVGSLLTHLEKAGSDFLKPAEIGELAATCERPDPLIGQTIASYAIRSVIARGGMGTVYLSEQSSPRRSVALKVLSPGFWSQAAERRFAQESQILARLQHPNIAQVFEAGTQQLDSGGVARYFAMELVPNAQQITDFADEKKLDIKERLTIFLQVCDAVQYGHSKGVIHRDLKPANILVGSDLSQASGPGSLAVVKVIDFGVARVVDTDVALTTMHTDTGQLIGTLAYMSPEQCDADPLGLDVRSDVYSLGVVLYELLCGRPPYEVSKTSIAAAATTIRDAEPTRPSLILRKLRGDLETVVLKALEKDRTKRYASVADLLRDIHHFLRDEPIDAQRTTPWVQAMRWAMRRPKTVTAVFCLGLVSIVTSLTVLSVKWANARPSEVRLTSSIFLRNPAAVGTASLFDRASLISLSGRQMQEWGGEIDSIAFAQLVDRPTCWGGGKVVVIGFTHTAKPPFSGKVCVFDANDLEGPPLHQLTIEQDVIDRMPSDAWPRPQSDAKRRYCSSEFRVKCGAVVDVFSDDDEEDAPEIVTVHQHHPGSQVALRIYNLNGEVLFQAWQDGGIDGLHWLPGEKFLVCLGNKGDKKPEDYDPTLEALHPTVLFAIRPTRGAITSGWIHPHKPDWWRGEWYRPEWYKLICFAGNKYTNFLGPRLETGDARIDPTQACVLGVSLMNVLTPFGKWYDIQAVFDSSGKIVASLPLGDVSEQAWKQDSALPNPAMRTGDLQLLEWTEINPPCGQAAPQPAD